MGEERPRQVLALHEAAAMLGLPADTVADLVGQGYLEPSRSGGEGGPEFALSDVKAFLARNAENGTGADVGLRIRRAPEPEVEAGSPELVDGPGSLDLLEALDQRSETMAGRVLDIFSHLYPEAVAHWGAPERSRFLAQARGRFAAILAVTAQGSEVDEAIVGDLESVGAGAVRSGTSLPQLLVLLRISRDLIVQAAVELADGGGTRGSLDLALLLTRILPAMDRLTDSLVRGYWSALLERQEASLGRLRQVVDGLADGVYEVDLDGRITFVNPAFALIVGFAPGELAGRELTSVLRVAPDGGSVAGLLADSGPGSLRHRLVILRRDGVRRVLELQTMGRYDDDRLVGFVGVVRDRTAVSDMEADRQAAHRLAAAELRAVVDALAATAGAPAEADAVRAGHLLSRLEGLSEADLAVGVPHVRPVSLRAVVGEVLRRAEVSDNAGNEIDAGLWVIADLPLLTEAFGQLVDNAIRHGRPPVRARAEARSGEVVVTVSDAGAGIPPERLPQLFAGLSALPPDDGRPVRLSGLGRARRLAEAMGGRIWYEHSEGETRLRLVLVPAQAPTGAVAAP